MKYKRVLSVVYLDYNLENFIKILITILVDNNSWSTVSTFSNINIYK